MMLAHERYGIRAVIRLIKVFYIKIMILFQDFNPNSATDHFKWIPTGLFYDIIDARNDATAIPRIVNIDDQVNQSSNFYNNQKLFNAFNSSVTTLGAYRQNLLLQNSNNQSSQVISLFSQYGY
jgi:hypothetical protein